MKFDFENKEAYYHTDEFGMIVVKGDPLSYRDSIGRNFWAYLAYGDHRFVNAIRRCHILFDHSAFSNQHEITFGRHPTDIGGDMSRDHVTYTLLAFKLSSSLLLKHIAENATRRISDKFRFTQDMWCWMKAIAGGKTWKYYTWTYLGSIIYPAWNRVVRFLCDIKPEVDQEDWSQDTTRKATKRQRIGRKFAIPQYSIGIRALQLYVMPDSKTLQRRKKRLLRMVGKTNYVIRAILGEKHEVEYKQMTNWRWSTTLDALNKRHLEIITDEKLISANRLEEDILKVI